MSIYNIYIIYILYIYIKDGTEEPYRVLRHAVGNYMGERGYTYMPFMAIPEHLSSQERVCYYNYMT